MTTTPANNTPQRPCASLDANALLGLLSQMMLIRRFEERCAQSYQQAKVGGFCHLYIGQEAVAVGSIAAIRPDDPIITAYRDHGHALARGMDPKYAMAEMFGKATGCCKGKGGSMHLFDKAHHMYGGHAIVGGQCPLGVGLAFAIQYQNKDNLCVCYLGDGALNQGAFHESMNLAAIQNLPILFAVENNRYSMGTHIDRGTSKAQDLSAKADAYAMRYDQCDGMDALHVYDCFATQAHKVRQGQGPALIDCQTYRYKGHSMSDPQKYRSKDEVAQQQQLDPITSLVTHIIDRNLATQQAVDDLDKHAKAQAIDAVHYANESPDVGTEELYTDIYSQPFPPYTKSDPPVMLAQHE